SAASTPLSSAASSTPLSSTEVTVLSTPLSSIEFTVLSTPLSSSDLAGLSSTEFTVTGEMLLVAGVVEATVLAGVVTTGRSSARWAANGGAGIPMTATPAAVQISDFFI